MRHAALFLAQLLLFGAPSDSAYADLLFPNDYLYPRQRVTATGCYYRLDMQTDGNMVLYAGQGVSHALWVSNTEGRGGYAVFQTDANFVIYDWNDLPVWSSGLVNGNTAWLDVQNDGNVVIYATGTRTCFGQCPLWATGTSGPALGQTPCYTWTAYTRQYPDTDMPGNDYKWLTLARASPSLCGRQCSQESKCWAFTYVPPGVQGSQAMCWLKSSWPAEVDWTTRKGFMSGIR